ncbi:MAG TPA: mitochondrial fission ELM1 family protein [Caulobacteraceae bacterium]|nr:mitochondrial fission ELM1 family protein [Caulobacteraceae bacterium]
MAVATPARKVWAVSDGRAGIAAQVEGLAQAVARRTSAEVTLKRIAYKGGLGKLPALMNLFPRQALADKGEIAPPWPDIWIAAGRATLPFSIRVKRWSKGKTLVVQVQDPRLPPHLFDLVIPPGHDRLSGDNVLPIVGSPHRVTPARLAAERARFARLVDPWPQPRVAVLIGGTSKAFDLSSERASEIARLVRQGIENAGGSLFLTFSRRTPRAARSLIAARLRDLPGVIWDGEGDNPYFAFLGAADHILVTEDSTNMAAEAASTGKPVHVLKMDGHSEKFARFHAELQLRGAARPYTGLERWTYEPLNETDRAAVEVLRVWESHGADRNHR